MCPAPLPVGDDKRGIAPNVSADLVVVELALGSIFGAAVRMVADRIVDALLRSPIDLDGADIHLHAKNFYCGEGA